MPHPSDAVAGSVALHSVTKRYGDFVAVDAISLSVRAGEFLSILGPSGSGKTTTMRMIGGFAMPSEGIVEISGVDVTTTPAYQRDVNTVFQSYALFPHMTIEDNVSYGLRMRGVRKQERRRLAAEMLEVVRLPEVAKQRPAQLSGGMQQRVALARALINRPSVLLLDEPLGALDRQLRENMQIELRQLQASLGTTFIYVTHDQDEALSMADRLAVMRNGRIEQLGPPADVYDAPASLWVAGFVGTSNQLPGTVRKLDGDRVEIETDHGWLLADYAHADLRAGSAAVAVVRPDDVAVLSAAESNGSTPNSIKARVEELLTIGGHLKVVARTAGGRELLARVPRGGLEQSTHLRPGSDVHLSWVSGNVRAYPSGEPATPVADAA
jgi:spermidine/putrescine transport system ATP-binding protein